MALLARYIEKAPAGWAAAEDHWEAGDFAYAILDELADGRSRGLSFFEVSSNNDPLLHRLAAALYLGSQQSELRSAQFRFVELHDLDKIGVSYQKTRGSFGDRTLDERHYDVTGLTGPIAVELARLLLQSVKILSADEILVEIARGLRTGYLEVTQIKKNGATEFWKRQALRYLKPKPQPRKKSVAASIVKQ